MQSTRSWLTAATLILGMAASFTAVAAPAETTATETPPSHPMLNDRFILELGGYYSRSSTQAGLAATGSGIGVNVDFENTLGLEERNLTPVFGFLWRMSERWRLEVDYFRLDREATKVLATEVEWGDQVFPVNTEVDSVYQFSDARVSLGYSFFKRPDKELGIGLGVHVAGIAASIEAAGIGNEASDVLAPLPVLNLYGAFALTSEWAVRLRMDWLSLTYGDYSGDVRNTAIDVLYQPFRHVGFGLGMRSLVLDVEIATTDWTGQARTAYTGPTAFMTASF